jgi:hypothetical protein
MNRYDDRFSRGRRSEYERDDWRDRERQGREPTRESFHPGNYGFEEGEDTGRTAGGPEQQPFSRNPYGYYPGQNRAREEWRDRDRDRDDDRGSRERYGSQRFGQREPYNTRGEYSRGGPFRSERDDDSRRYGTGGSRYSESQYSSSPRRGREEGGEYARRYGSGGETRYGFERGFGEGPFADTTEPPGYFGTGYYGDGGAGPGGGFDQRTRPRNYGSLGEDTFSSERGWGSPGRGWGGSERRARPGPKGYTRSDDRLREDICERLMLANSVDSTEVTVTVKDGQVTLEGTVPNRRMKHTIEDLVDAAPGVQDIDNRIRVERGEAGSSSSGSCAASGGSTAQRPYSQGTLSSGTASSGTTQTAGSSTTQSASGSSTTSGSTQRRKE